MVPSVEDRLKTPHQRGPLTLIKDYLMCPCRKRSVLGEQSAAEVASKDMQMIHVKPTVIGSESGQQDHLHISQINPDIENNLREPLLGGPLTPIGLPYTSVKQLFATYLCGGIVGGTTAYATDQTYNDEVRISITATASIIALLLASQCVGINKREAFSLLIGAVIANVVGEEAGVVMHNDLDLYSSSSNPYGTPKRIVFATTIGVSAGALAMKLIYKLCNHRYPSNPPGVSPNI